jgi:hypothetical protein
MEDELSSQRLCAVFDGMWWLLVGTCGKTCTPTCRRASRCYNAFATDRCWNLTRLSTTLLIRKTPVATEGAVLVVRYYQRSIRFDSIVAAAIKLPPTVEDYEGAMLTAS